MSRTLIKNGYLVTVNPQREVLPAGYMVVDGCDIAEIGPQDKAPGPDGFDEIIDAEGCLVLPGLINMHQHHWYTLFKGLADGYLLEDWVTDFLLPITLKMTPEANILFPDRCVMTAGLGSMATLFSMAAIRPLSSSSRCRPANIDLTISSKKNPTTVITGSAAIAVSNGL